MRASMLFGTPGHALGGTSQKKSLANLSPVSALPPFLKLGQTTQVGSGSSQLGDLLLLVLPCLGLMFAFGQLVLDIIAVIPRVGFQSRD